MEHTITEPLTESERFDGLRQELRRGCLALAVLGQLRREQYGYTLRKALEAVGLEIDESTLYPLLRRLESQGLLESEWRETDKRRKRFYRLSSSGERVLAMLNDEFTRLNAALARITQEV
jgi:PadR family transcriptional regulator, regulatory protein PadR